jgi:hypothetical protein
MLTYFFLSFSGFLRTLFDTLYDEDIISEDAFNQWETSKDPAEQEGKGLAGETGVSRRHCQRK